ncbi:MAG: SDR family oxidoreductase [Pseudomonadota bacterium]
MKTVIVTGGATGIGRGIVERLAPEYRVLALWHQHAPDALPDGVMTVRGDLTTAAGLEAILAEINAQVDGPIHGLVNNAGLVAESPMDGFDPEPVQAMFQLNTIVPALLLAGVLPRMEAGASVVNISSVNADLPPKGAALYGASKAALNTWTKGAAKELGPRGIRVNALAPGAVNTPEKPRSEELTAAFAGLAALGRVGAPNDIAGVVAFLLSDEAAYLTGEVVRVSGGYRL